MGYVNSLEGSSFWKPIPPKSLGLRNPSIRIWLHPFSATKHIRPANFSTKKAVEFSKESLTPKSFVGLNVWGGVLKTLYHGKSPSNSHLRDYFSSSILNKSTVRNWLQHFRSVWLKIDVFSSSRESRWFRSNYPFRNIKECLDEFERRTWSFYRQPVRCSWWHVFRLFLAAPQTCAEISPKKQVTFERSSDLFFW